MSEKIHGNSKNSQKTTYLYQLFDNLFNFLKWGITSEEDPEKRYTKKYMVDKIMVIVDKGIRALMLIKERKNVETNPGKLNKEKWAGSKSNETD